jgi:ATP-dependent protease ClpP protease subunit
MVDSGINENMITVNDNKIHFWADITAESCKILLDHILEIEQKYENILSSYYTNIDNLPVIELYINSDGGTIIDALAIVDHILASKFKFVSIIQGSAASAATMISVVCDYRKIYKNAMMMIHEMSAGVRGRFSYMKDDMKCNDKLMNTIINMYIDHTKLDKKTLEMLLVKDIYWNADECLFMGLVDKVIDNIKIKKRTKRKIILTPKMINKCKILKKKVKKKSID